MLLSHGYSLEALWGSSRYISSKKKRPGTE